MAINDDIPPTRGPLSTRIGGFTAGIAITLVLGLVASVAYNGQGLGDLPRTPPQVYTNF